MSKIIIAIIKIYQKTLSPDKGFFSARGGSAFGGQISFRGCRFHPTCSQYAIDAIEKRGLLKGTFSGAKRILKCHPWHPGGYDPVQ
ncbi:MAG: membrane protein insertion efficiency factor YidD [Patescibacteria group bacterium]|mgnify:CR=1 FL=1